MYRRSETGPGEPGHGYPGPFAPEPEPIRRRPCLCVACDDACIAEGDAKICEECADAPGDTDHDCHGTPDPQ